MEGIKPNPLKKRLFAVPLQRDTLDSINTILQGITMKKTFFYSFLGLIFFVNCHGYIDTKRWFGTIQFPQILEKVPSVRIYRAGEKMNGLSVDYDHEGKRICFSFPEREYQKTIYVIITPKFWGQNERGSTAYLKIDPEQDYKFYMLEHRDNEWTSKRLAVPYDTGRIPDTTIIICSNSDWFEDPIKGNDYELPIFVVNNQIFDEEESEDTLHERFCEILLACLDTDTLHTGATSLVKCEKNMIITLEQSS